MSSRRVSEFSRKTPSIVLVTMETPGLCTPRVVMHSWADSIITATPCGSNSSLMVLAIDLVCDGCDNFATRYVVNAACVKTRKVLVSAAVQRFEGQLSTFRPWCGGPCYHCLYPQTDGEASGLSCGEAGVFGAVTGVMGTLQATEALKELLNIGQSMAGRLLMWDALRTRFTTIMLEADPNCPVCGGMGVEQACTPQQQATPSAG